jgi:hypothetical protein
MLNERQEQQVEEKKKKERRRSEKGRSGIDRYMRSR